MVQQLDKPQLVQDQVETDIFNKLDGLGFEQFHGNDGRQHYEYALHTFDHEVIDISLSFGNQVDEIQFFVESEPKTHEEVLEYLNNVESQIQDNAAAWETSWESFVDQVITTSPERNNAEVVDYLEKLRQPAFTQIEGLGSILSVDAEQELRANWAKLQDIAHEYGLGDGMPTADEMVAKHQEITHGFFSSPTIAGLLDAQEQIAFERKMEQVEELIEIRIIHEPEIALENELAELKEAQSFAEYQQYVAEEKQFGSAVAGLADMIFADPDPQVADGCYTEIFKTQDATYYATFDFSDYSTTVTADRFYDEPRLFEEIDETPIFRLDGNGVTESSRLLSQDVEVLVPLMETRISELQGNDVIAESQPLNTVEIPQTNDPAQFEQLFDMAVDQLQINQERNMEAVQTPPAVETEEKKPIANVITGKDSSIVTGTAAEKLAQEMDLEQGETQKGSPKVVVPNERMDEAKSRLSEDFEIKERKGDELKPTVTVLEQDNGGVNLVFKPEDKEQATAVADAVGGELTETKKGNLMLKVEPDQVSTAQAAVADQEMKAFVPPPKEQESGEKAAPLTIKDKAIAVGEAAIANEEGNTAVRGKLTFEKGEDGFFEMRETESGKKLLSKDAAGQVEGEVPDEFKKPISERHKAMQTSPEKESGQL